MENLLNLDLKAIIEAVGYSGVFAMVFAESGLLIGIVLPGDSLLFTAGFLASAGVFNIFFLSLGSFLAAVLGDNVGYSFGRRIGPRIFNQEDSFWFHKNHLLKAENFYRKHGGKAVVLARFLPIVRTFAPIVAGVGKMNYQTFLFYNLIGGFLWAVGVTVSGYFLGRLIPDVDKYLLPILLSIIIISLLPTVVHLLSSKFKN